MVLPSILITRQEKGNLTRNEKEDKTFSPWTLSGSAKPINVNTFYENYEMSGSLHKQFTPTTQSEKNRDEETASVNDIVQNNEINNLIDDTPQSSWHFYQKAQLKSCRRILTMDPLEASRHLQANDDISDLHFPIQHSDPFGKFEDWSGISMLLDAAFASVWQLLPCIPMTAPA